MTRFVTPIPARRIPWTVVIAFALAACSGPSTPNPAAASPTSSSEDRDASNLPAGCGPIDLVGPSGQRIDLTGEWGGDNWFSGRSSGERTFLLQLGDCVWITITDRRFHDDPIQGASILGVLPGHITNDFVIVGDLVTILRDAPVGGFSDQQTFAAIRLVVDFDADERILLREDREPQVQGPRCTHPPSACPDPIILFRVEDLPAPAPSPT